MLKCCGVVFAYVGVCTLWYILLLLWVSDDLACFCFVSKFESGIYYFKFNVAA